MLKIKTDQEFIRMKTFKLSDKPEEKSKGAKTSKKKNKRIEFDLEGILTVEGMADILGVELAVKPKSYLYLLNQSTKVHLLGLSMDIQEEKEIEEEMQKKMNEELKELDQDQTTTPKINTTKS
jgi:hypothetical protein